MPDDYVLLNVCTDSMVELSCFVQVEIFVDTVGPDAANALECLAMAYGVLYVKGTKRQVSEEELKFIGDGVVADRTQEGSSAEEPVDLISSDEDS